MSELILKREYNPDPAQWSGIAAALRRHLLPLLPPERQFNGSTFDGRERTLFFVDSDEIDQILGSGPNAPDFQMIWKDADSTTDIKLQRVRDVEPGLVELSLSLAVDRKKTARAAIDAFERELCLTALDQHTRQAVPNEEVRLTYEYENSDFDPNAAYAYMVQEFARFQSEPKPDIRIERPSESGGRHSVYVAQKDLPDTTVGLKMISLRLSDYRSGLPHIELRFNAGRFSSSEINCTVAPGLIDQVKLAIRNLEQVVGLKPYRDADVSLHGEKRIYFSKAGTELDLAWFRRFTEYLDRLMPNRHYFDAAVQLVPSPSEEETHATPTELVDRLATQWQDVQAIVISCSGPAIRLQATVEPMIDWVHIALWAINREKAADLLDKLAADLRLDWFKSNPYERPVTQTTYSIGHLDRAAFAAAIRDIVGPVMRRPILVDSYIGDRGPGGEIHNVYFDDLDKMLDRIANGKDIAGLYIQIRKPKGDCISFNIDPEHSILSIKSSFDSNRTAGVNRTLKRRLSLSDLGSGDASRDAPRGLLSRKFDPATIQGRVLILFFGCLTGLGGFMTDRFFPDIAVTITVPRNQGTQPAAVVSGCMDIIWLVREDDWFSEGTERLDATGDVTLARSDAGRTYTLAGHRSGDKVHVAPGSWDIFVHDPQLRRTSAPVRIDAANSGYAERKPEIEADCGSLGG